MTLRHLEIFLPVCRFMSMTKAAAALNMTQPAVSKAISELESFYHVSLFDRIGRRLYLSDAGKALNHYADTILSQYEESVTFLRDGSSFQSCRLSVNVTVGETILPELCRTVYERLPEIDLQISVHNTAAIENQLRSNECDIAIIDRSDDPSFNAIPLYREPIVFVASDSLIPRSHILKEDLLKQRLLLRETGSGNRACVDAWLNRISFPRSRIWECTSDETLLTMAEAGLGIAALPQSYFQKTRNRSVHTVAVGGEPFQRTFYLLYMQGKYLNRITLQCIDIIRKTVGK